MKPWIGTLGLMRLVNESAYRGIAVRLVGAGVDRLQNWLLHKGIRGVSGLAVSKNE
jgi:hypothetical protein